MSFYTSLMYYRPCKPPIITGNDLARVVARLAETGKLKPSGMYGVKAKFGVSIDCDDKDTIWYESTTPGIALVHEIEWDVESLALRQVEQVIEAFAGRDDSVYRARLLLGTLTPDVLKPITRLNSPQNTIDFQPYDLSLEIGPITAGDLATEERVHVGWISLSISGSGYLYPWTLSEAMRRVSDSPSIQALTEVVRSAWPVPAGDPDQEIMELRRQIPSVWPYRADLMWDWYWGAHETG